MPCICHAKLDATARKGRRLRPIRSQVYSATAEGMVRNEARYSEFNALENASCAELNAGPKPKQQTAKIAGVLRQAVQALRPFDELMRATAEAANAGDATASAGGVLWELAPLKHVSRCLEKMCLDPKQRAALDARDPEQLDASGMLDVVRR